MLAAGRHKKRRPAGPDVGLPPKGRGRDPPEVEGGFGVRSAVPKWSRGRKPESKWSHRLGVEEPPSPQDRERRASASGR